MKRKEASRQKTDAQHGSQLNWERKWEFQHSKKVSLQIGKVNGVFCCLFGVRSQLNRKRSVVCPPPPFLIFPLCLCLCHHQHHQTNKTVRLYLSTLSHTYAETALSTHCDDLLPHEKRWLAGWPVDTEREGGHKQFAYVVPQQKLSTTELNFGLQMIYYLTSSSSSWIDGQTDR